MLVWNIIDDSYTPGKHRVSCSFFHNYFSGLNAFNSEYLDFSRIQRLNREEFEGYSSFSGNFMQETK
jgi:hypothetical protein